MIVGCEFGTREEIRKEEVGSIFRQQVTANRWPSCNLSGAQALLFLANNSQYLSFLHTPGVSD